MKHRSYSWVKWEQLTKNSTIPNQKQKSPKLPINHLKLVASRNNSVTRGRTGTAYTEWWLCSRDSTSSSFPQHTSTHVGCPIFHLKTQKTQGPKSNQNNNIFLTPHPGGTVPFVFLWHQISEQFHMSCLHSFTSWSQFSTRLRLLAQPQ
jgi:hypothetical protein